MNWLQKISAPITTQDFPGKLAVAIQYECGGIWEASESTNWTEDSEKILPEHRQRNQEEGYSTGFWVTCENGDGYFRKKWGVHVYFTVFSGSSNTVFDSETGDWDFSIDANVQRAADASWTPSSPYALMMEAVGNQTGMRTIQETAIFVKNAIWNSQSDDGEFEEPEDEPTPDPGINAPVANPEFVNVGY